MRRARTSRIARTAIVAIPLAALLAAAGAAEAQNNHYVSASIGQGVPQGEASFDPAVPFVDTQWSDGVPGTAGGGREINASANSASGIMSVEGVTDNRLNGNRKSASARIDQRMKPNDNGPYGPVTVVVSLGASGGGAPYARSYAELAVDDCQVSVVKQVGGGSAGTTTNESNCDDNASVDWTTSASRSGITIEADFASRPCTCRRPCWVLSATERSMSRTARSRPPAISASSRSAATILPPSSRTRF